MTTASLETFAAVTRVCDALGAAADSLGVPRVDVLRLVVERYGEQLAEPALADQLEAIADDLGIEIGGVR